MAARRRIFQCLIGLLIVACGSLSNATLVNQSGPRCYGCTGSVAASEWADVYITDVANIGTQLATAGRKVGVEVGSNFTGLSQQLSAGNGATMDIVAGGSFDGQENAVRIYPP